MQKEKKLETLRVKAKCKWLDYLSCQDVKKSTQILKSRCKTLDKLQKLQTEVNSFILNPKKNDAVGQEKNYEDGLFVQNEVCDTYNLQNKYLIVS